MYAFLQSLTADERTLLGHQCMTYLDETLGAPKSGDPYGRSGWDKGHERISHEVVIGGVKTTIQGFKRRHLELRDDHQPNNGPISYQCIAFMGNLANYQSPQASLSKRERDIEADQFGVMYCGQRSGSSVLFDHPVYAQYVMCLSLSDAALHSNDRADPNHGEISISDGMSLWDIEMSQEQFVRMIRGEYTEVPCTIGRSFGYLHDRPPADHHVARKLSSGVRGAVREITQPLSEKVKAACDTIGSGALTSKKKMLAMLDLINEIETEWGALRGSIKETQEEAVEQVKAEFQRRLIDQVDKDTQQLPPSERQALLGLLRDI